MLKRRKTSHVDFGRNAQAKHTEPESSEPDILFRLSGDTELHCAALADDYVTVCSLVRRGDAIEARNKNGETPFQLACRCDKKKVARVRIGVILPIHDGTGFIVFIYAYDTTPPNIAVGFACVRARGGSAWPVFGKMCAKMELSVPFSRSRHHHDVLHRFPRRLGT